MSDSTADAARDLSKALADAAKTGGLRTPNPGITNMTDVGLSDTKILTTPKDFFVYVAGAVLHYLDFTPDNETDHNKAIEAYLTSLGVTSEKALSRVDKFPAPDDAMKRKELVTFSILRALETIANVVKIANKEKFFLHDSSKIDSLLEWSDQVTEIRQNSAVKPGSTTTLSSSNAVEKRFPSLELKKFTSFDGDNDKFLMAVFKDFTEKKIISFLENEKFADTYPDESKAYCFTLFKSLNGSAYEYFYSDHHKTIFNSATLWLKLKTMLTTNVSEMAAVDAAWNRIYQLKCDDVESFDMFFSNFVTAENKLVELNSIAITDNSFLRSLLFHKLNIEELKSETAQLILGDLKTQVRDFLEDLNKKAKALSINRDGKATSRSRKVNVQQHDQKKQKTEKTASFKQNESKISAFPKNEKQKLTPQVYNQIKNWFELVTIPEAQRSKEQKHKLENFALKVPNPNKNYERNQERKAARKAKLDEENDKNEDPAPPDYRDQQNDRHNYHNHHEQYRYNNNSYDYNQGQSYWPQQQMPDSYARRATAGNQNNYQNRFHQSPYGRGHGGRGGGRGGGRY